MVDVENKINPENPTERHNTYPFYTSPESIKSYAEYYSIPENEVAEVLTNLQASFSNDGNLAHYRSLLIDNKLKDLKNKLNSRKKTKFYFREKRSPHIEHVPTFPRIGQIFRSFRDLACRINVFNRQTHRNK